MPASPEPSLNHPLPPLPPASEGRPSTTTCSKHPLRVLGCRFCGTTPRQIAAAQKRAQAEADRQRERDQLLAARAEKAQRLAAGRSPEVDAIVKETRLQIAKSR